MPELPGHSNTYMARLYKKILKLQLKRRYLGKRDKKSKKPINPPGFVDLKEAYNTIPGKRLTSNGKLKHPYEFNKFKKL